MADSGKRSEIDFLAEAVAHASDPVLTLDAKSNVLSVNQAFTDLTGYTLAEMVAGGVMILRSELEAPEVYDLLWKITETGEPWNGELISRRKDGSHFKTMLHLSPFRGPDGAPTGFVAMHRHLAGSQENLFQRQPDSGFMRMFDKAWEGVFQSSLDGKPLAVNAVVAQIHGYDSVEDFLINVRSMRTDVWAIPQERDRFVESLLRDGQVNSYECCALRRDGTHGWILLSAQLVRDGAGNPAYIEGFVLDVTEQRKAEVAFAESEERFRRFFEQSGSVMIIVEPESGRIVDVNPAAARYYGYTREQLLAMNITEINILPHEEIYAERQRALQKGQPYFEFRHRLASGEIREVEVYSSPVEVHGEPVLFSIVLDVTERRKTERHLRESEERYRAAFDQAAVGMVHVSLDHKILRCNERYAQISGYTQDELVGQSISQIVPRHDRGEVSAMDHKMIDGKIDSFSAERCHRRKDGSLTWVKLTVSLLRTETGKPLHFITLAEDINERKLAEAKLEKAVRELRTTEDRYRAAFENTIYALSIIGFDGTCIDINQPCMNLFGYTREEIVGRTTLELSIWVDLDKRQHVRELLQIQPQIDNIETRFRRKNGEIFWCKLSASVVELSGANCVLCVMTDITAEKLGDEKLAAAHEALRMSEDRYRAAFETALDAIAIANLDGTFIDVNQPYIDLFGYSRAELIGNLADGHILWQNPQQQQFISHSLKTTGACRDLEARMRKKNGDLFWVRFSLSAIQLNGRKCVLTILRDISAEKEAADRLQRANDALRQSEARYRAAFQASADSININRISDGAYVECNQAFLDMFGYRREEVIGHTSQELKIWANLEDRYAIYDLVRQNGNCREFESQFRKKSGEVFWGRLSASPIELDGVPCLLTVGRDISGTKTIEDEIRSLAFYDQLTQLPNRRLLQDRLKKALSASARSGQIGAVLFIDLDNFKTLNDTLGHQTGDLLLQEVSARLTACTRESDTVARLGGDEFVVVLENLGNKQEEAATFGKNVAEKILAAINRPYLLGEHECMSTCSIGVAVYGQKPITMDDIMQQADIAMYHSKGAGRNTVRFFAPELQAAVNVRAATENDLRHAIATQQFLLYAQPQVDSGRIIGAEVLLRWQHPRRGLLSPAEFITLAEESGLILPLGEWALETAFKQSASWEEHHELSRLTLAVNISARQFRQPEFVTHVLNILYRTGANPQKIRMELTESMLVDNLDDVVAKMTQLKAHGFRFALDDFGTGYSSLAYLKRLPLDQLKIDRLFVRDLLTDNGSGAIAETIVSLGKAMGLPVVAEGIETEEQRAFLVNLGCHAFQGHLFGRPMPIPDFEHLF